MFHNILLHSSTNIPIEKVRYLPKYLDGDWLEHCVADAFHQHREDRKIHATALSLEVDAGKSIYHRFEFDVAALQGYQLYAVSCTRDSTRARCKHKLFESFVRATQIGGDECRVGLVCCDKNTESLEQEVREAWRLERGRIKVFGPADLPKLPDSIYKWLSS